MQIKKNIAQPNPVAPASGAAMDTVVPRRRGKAIAIAVASVLAVAAAVYALWSWMPRGLQIDGADLRIGQAARGVFVDEIVVRANAEPLNSVILDSVESGRVEEVLASDGALVKKGQLLFRISNPQRNLELLARQSEHAVSIFNLSNLRVAQESSASDHRRRLDELQFEVDQARKQHQRNTRLAAQGFISSVALEESADKLQQQQRQLANEERASSTEDKVRSAAAQQLESAIDGLNSGLKLVSGTVDALAVRAPVEGRLTNFRLQVGESIATGKNIGRIDDPVRFKLSASVDEYYLNRMAVGRKGSVKQDDKSYGADISTIYPQIKEGRFTVEMVFKDGQPRVALVLLARLVDVEAQVVQPPAMVAGAGLLRHAQVGQVEDADRVFRLPRQQFQVALRIGDAEQQLAFFDQRAVARQHFLDAARFDRIEDHGVERLCVGPDDDFIDEDAARGLADAQVGAVDLQAARHPGPQRVAGGGHRQHRGDRDGDGFSVPARHHGIHRRAAGRQARIGLVDIFFDLHTGHRAKPVPRPKTGASPALRAPAGRRCSISNTGRCSILNIRAGSGVPGGVGLVRSPLAHC